MHLIRVVLITCHFDGQGGGSAPPVLGIVSSSLNISFIL
jgi:hypothetical protein